MNSLKKREGENCLFQSVKILYSLKLLSNYCFYLLLKIKSPSKSRKRRVGPMTIISYELYIDAFKKRNFKLLPSFLS